MKITIITKVPFKMRQKMIPVGKTFTVDEKEAALYLEQNVAELVSEKSKSRKDKDNPPKLPVENKEPEKTQADPILRDNLREPINKKG